MTLGETFSHVKQNLDGNDLLFFLEKSLSDGITNLAFTLPCLGANPLMLEAPEK